MIIDVLLFEGCPSGEETIALVGRALVGEKLGAVVNRIEVKDEEAAQAQRFLGSPSVRVDGLEIEEARREDLNYGLACRMYRTPAGLVGVPPIEMVRKALRSARQGTVG